MIAFNIGFYGWPAIIALTIYLNWHRIKRGIKPHYLTANISRAFMGLICLLIMSSRDGFNGIDFAYPRTLIPYIPHMVYILSSFYLFFDPGLSWLRGLKWNYRGKDSGWLDGMGIMFYYTLKVICLIALVWSVVIIFHGKG